MKPGDVVVAIDSSLFRVQVPNGTRGIVSDPVWQKPGMWWVLFDGTEDDQSVLESEVKLIEP